MVFKYLDYYAWGQVFVNLSKKMFKSKLIANMALEQILTLSGCCANMAVNLSSFSSEGKLTSHYTFPELNQKQNRFHLLVEAL